MAERDSPKEPRRYANRLVIGFNTDEFVLDFGQEFERSPLRIHSGIITTPAGARNFLSALQNSVTEHSQSLQAPHTEEDAEAGA